MSLFDTESGDIPDRAGGIAEPGSSQPDALRVERSVSGRRWRLRQDADRAVLALAQRSGLPEIVCRLLAARGIVEAEAAELHLAPTLRALLPDPSRLADMDRAADRLAEAVRCAETVGVFGDYDVDGATSAALLLRYLRALGVPTLSHIPDRRLEGYGPNLPALLRLQAAGARLVVTVDCGTLAHEPLAAAAAAGMEVIVVDHHAAEAHLPIAHAVVNPNRLDDTSGKGRLAAVGVVFLLLIATNRALRRGGWFVSRPEPDLLAWLDLVALGTVADVVPLEGLNRALVTQGLKVMAAGRSAGLAALAETAGIKGPLDPYHLGFVLGPRINAGGRIGRADLGLRLLTTEDPDQAMRLAAEAEASNQDRREIEAAVLARALEVVEAEGCEDGLVFAVGLGWHPGVIGIVAARLKERFNRPAICVAVEDGLARASGRSVQGVGLGQAVIAAGQAGLTLGGGGHAMAAGFSAHPSQLGALRRFLAERIAENQDGQRGGQPCELLPELVLDGVLLPMGATAELAELLRRLGPFGARNAEPRFALATVRVAQPAFVGQGHVRCALVGGGGERLKAIAFRSADTPLGRALIEGHGRTFHVAGYLRHDTWSGSNGVQLLIEDLSPA